MLFTSSDFVLFLLIVFSLYYLPISRLGKAYQVTVLLVASAVFYGWDDPRLLILLLISCLGNTVCSICILKHRQEGHEECIKRWVAVSVVLNLLLLGVFKYAGFIGELIPGLPVGWTQWLKDIPLPIGISFYTFHGISMIVDVAKGNVKQSDASDIRMESGASGFLKATRDVGFYMLFFPQLIAGPIVRARQFWPQIEAKKFRDIQWGTAIRFLVLGYFLKMVCADNLSEYTLYLKDIAIIKMSGTPELLGLMFGYSCQIFADFGGYSFIAIGLAVLFGYRLPDNFNLPYLSTSITEFWRRWNMTLSHWLRDYLYIPLGGNRNGAVMTYVNLFIVMFLGGLWHGAEWKFAIWGTAHGLFLALERLIWQKNSARHPLMKLMGGIYCFMTVSFLWMTFLMPNTETLFAFFGQLFTCKGGVGNIVLFSLTLYCTPVVLYHFVGWTKEHRAAWYRALTHPIIGGLVYGAMLFLIFNNAGPSEGFIYFQF